VVATIRLYQSGSVLLGSTQVNLAGKTGTQVSNIFQVVGFGSMATTNGYATVESDNGLPLFSYAATADNATQDPVLVVGSGDLPAPAGFHPSTPTPAGTSAPAATPTPTPPVGVPQRIEIDVARYAFTPGTSAPIQVTAGNPTTLHFTSSDVTHGFSGIPQLGINGTNVISPGSYDPYGGGGQPVEYTVTFTAPASARGQSFPFSCTANPTCGSGHATMLGTLRVN
jgi:heme/copper-type cytochrome/quinol oxidase subunit 2